MADRRCPGPGDLRAGACRPLTRAHLTRRLGLLLGAWLVFHLVSQLVYVSLDVILQIDADPANTPQFAHVLPIYLSKKAAFTLIVFAGIVTVAHLTRLLGEVREREREAARLEAALAGPASMPCAASYSRTSSSTPSTRCRR